MTGDVEQGPVLDWKALAAHERDLDFTPRPQVRWLAPGQLARTALKTALAMVFADYADKREIQAALPTTPLDIEADADGGLWIDHVADLGDGFDATYTIASLLAKDTIPVPHDGGTSELPRASLLVMGGDQVYPTASAGEYEDRMKGPYRAALPHLDVQPTIVALPGNHDWYDGLTSFLRVFTQGGSIGGWKTKQQRSYFVVALPHRWWLVGLDSQLGTYIDEPQLNYFRANLTARLKKGDGVIVCSAAPTWLKSGEGGQVDAFNSLHWFDRNVVRRRIVDPETGGTEETGASIRLWLTGDRHHYCRYVEQVDQAPRHFVTCGLGGAYLTGTHTLPEALQLPAMGTRLRDRDDPAVQYRLAPTTYPERETSKRWARRLALPWAPEWLPRRNPGFPELLGVLHLVVFLGLTTVFAVTQGRTPVGVLRQESVTDALVFSAQIVAGLVVVAGILGVLRRTRSGATTRSRAVALAGVLQLVLALGLFVAVVAIAAPGSLDGAWVLLIAGAAVAVLGAVLGSEAFAIAIVTARKGPMVDWQMSGQAVEDGKGFVRLHLDDSGVLRLYPLLVDRICREWLLADDPKVAGRKRPIARPESLPEPRLIEAPIVISREP